MSPSRAITPLATLGTLSEVACPSCRSAPAPHTRDPPRPAAAPGSKSPAGVSTDTTSSGRKARPIGSSTSLIVAAAQIDAVQPHPDLGPRLAARRKDPRDKRQLAHGQPVGELAAPAERLIPDLDHVHPVLLELVHQGRIGPDRRIARPGPTAGRRRPAASARRGTSRLSSHVPTRLQRLGAQVEHELLTGHRREPEPVPIFGPADHAVAPPPAAGGVR